ncbi:MAG: MobA-like transferase domain, partial [Patescibacteria group bacterium]|nr:MobA-like transferase domain [Patescibacteria group bacterium]
MNVQPIILAAGKGTRMNNPDLPKALVPLKGQPVISYLLNTVQKDGF